jgi:hypothetical protein
VYICQDVCVPTSRVVWAQDARVSVVPPCRGLVNPFNVSAVAGNVCVLCMRLSDVYAWASWLQARQVGRGCCISSSDSVSRVLAHDSRARCTGVVAHCTWQPLVRSCTGAATGVAGGKLTAGASVLCVTGRSAAGFLHLAQGLVVPYGNTFPTAACYAEHKRRIYVPRHRVYLACIPAADSPTSLACWVSRHRCCLDWRSTAVCMGLGCGSECGMHSLAPPQASLVCLVGGHGLVPAWRLGQGANTQQPQSRVGSRRYCTWTPSPEP